MAEVAYIFHFSLTELLDMEIEELMEWHRQAGLLNERMKR